MKSAIPSKSGMGKDARRGNATRLSEAEPKGQIPHSDSPPSQQHSMSALRAAWRVVHATAGDHPSVHHFLVSLFQKPSLAEFQSQLEDPVYEPSDRLLIKNGDQIVAHLRLGSRAMRFGRLMVPVGLVADVATLPEYRRHGCATALLSAARKQLLRDGAVLGLLQTDLPRFYSPHGWAVCGRHCYSTAGPRDILAHLTAGEAQIAPTTESFLAPPRRKKYNIRLWRHVEQAALVRLYGENTQSGYGSLERSESYWRWLIGRGGNERIYVAIDGPDNFELDESFAPIVAYAAAREGRIVEIHCSPDHPEASIQLLARACGDAIERDYHRVRVDAPPDDPLHQLLIDAGGEHCHHEADQGMVFMVNLFKPRRFLKMLSRQLGERVKLAGLPRPCQLGLFVNNEKYRLSVSRRSVELIPGTLGRSYLKCSFRDVIQMLMGHLDVRDAVDSGRLSVSTRVAVEMAAALFPRLPLWRPPWDDLPA